MKSFVLFYAFLFLAQTLLFNGHCHGATQHNSNVAGLSDSLKADAFKSSAVKERFRNAFYQALGVNTVMWMYNRYIQQEAWARIGFKSLQTNIWHGWVYDDNRFNVNQFGHPYQGALVYMAARAQGLSMAEASTFPVLSSFIWEMGMETEYPSVNDMITTPLSGITYGEVMHRTSQLVLGRNPNWLREIFAFLIDPSLGFNRLFGNRQTKSLHPHLPKIYNAGISFGVGGYLINENKLNPERKFLRFHLFYGNPFNLKREKPFDYFSLITILNYYNGSLVGEIYSSGLLNIINYGMNGRYSYRLGFFKDYDFMNHDDFKVSSSSFGFGIMQNVDITPTTTWYNETLLSAIVLGSAGDTSDEIRTRDYYYGPGLSGKIFMVLTKRHMGNVYLRLKRYFVFNFEDLRTAAYENVNLIKLGLQIHVWNQVSAGGEYTFASRKSLGRSTGNSHQDKRLLQFHLIYHMGRIF